MILVQLSKFACLLGSLAYAHALAAYRGDNDGLQSRQTAPGRPSDGMSGAREVAGWISPEYKWIFEYPMPNYSLKEKKLTWTDNATGSAIDYYEIELKQFTSQIYPDRPATTLEGYDGISPGPMFRMQQGREAVVRFLNSVSSNMSVHVHGQYNRAPFDGWASDYATPGQYKDYYYPNAQNARTIWYHDHDEFDTARNAYHGQEGLYIISDPEEQDLCLPSGQYDISLVITAKLYHSNGSLLFDTNDNLGLWGDVIQVNGQPWPYVKVEPRKYRLRLLNGAISRTFQFSLHDEDGETLCFEVIGSDCGLLSEPVSTEDIFMAMGERYEIIVDFENYKGQNITMHNARGLGENPDFPATDRVIRFVVGDTVTDPSNNGPVPQSLREIPAIPTTAPVKNFAFGRGPGGRWTINGVGFTDIEHRILTRPIRGTTEIWTLRNVGGGGTHPVHIHLVDFQVLSRTGGRNDLLPYEEVGRKDVVVLAAGETVQVVARYAPWPGVYMFHCHNLVHEDHDMLTAFNVTQLAQWGYTNDTLFIDPMEPQFRPKPYNAADYTEEAILKKIAWFWSTNAYNRGDILGVYDALDQGGKGVS